MEIFDWVKDIEETYKYLIEKAKEENISDIQKFRAEQEKRMELLTKKKQEFVNSILEKVSEEVHDGIKTFNKQFISTLRKIEIQFNKNKKGIIKGIIQQLELSF